MDVFAVALAAVGLILAAKGEIGAGGTIYVGALVGLPVALAARSRLPTVLPFSFASHFVVMVLSIVAAVVIRSRYPVAATGCFGLFTYYYGCVALAERKIRYVPWAS